MPKLKTDRASHILLFLALLVVIGIACMILPEVGSREASCRSTCVNNLKNLAIAMFRYHEANGCFPPAFIADQNGRPMHSWRVLLLPYLEHEDLYKQYKFNEPWDSPSNRKLTDCAVRGFRCLSAPHLGKPNTSYMMVVGPHTISDGPHSRKVSEITDGTSKTIMLVEVADSGVRWAEPKDLSFNDLEFKINNVDRPGIGSHHSGGANAAFCDGDVRLLDAATPPEQLKAMLTIDGGEKIPKD
jgi:prepilin-type processing-associated H-X9-DG protein